MRIEVMSRKGHEVLAEVDSAIQPEAWKAINKRVRDLSGQGYQAFGASSGTRLKALTPDITEDVVLIAPLVGG